MQNLLSKIGRLVASTMLVALLCLSFGLPTLAFNFEAGFKETESNGLDADTTPTNALEQISKGSKLNDFADSKGKNVVTEAGLTNITGYIKQVTGIAKWALGAVAVVYFFYTATRLVTATDDADDVYNGAKKQMVYLLFGVFILIGTDIFLAQVLNLGGNDNLFSSLESARKYARLGSLEIRGIYNLGQMLIGFVAVSMIIYHGLRLVTNAGDEGVVDNAKRNITWGIAGLILIGLSELVIKDILFVDQGATFDPENLKRLIVRMTNFVSGFIATVAFLMGIYAGYLYIFSASGEDNTDKSKQIFIGAIIGIILAGSAFAIVNTVIDFNDRPSPAIFQDQAERIIQ